MSVRFDKVIAELTFVFTPHHPRHVSTIGDSTLTLGIVRAYFLLSGLLDSSSSDVESSRISRERSGWRKGPLCA